MPPPPPPPASGNGGPPATPNSKRYWGEEKNIDSVYYIYLKKISYSYNNDIALSAANQSQLSAAEQASQLADDSASCNSASSVDLSGANQRAAAARLLAQNSNLDTSKRLNSSTYNCQKPAEESPRERRNFFQKYRRRSCSMDKYSIDKNQQKSGSQHTPKSSAKSSIRNMKFLSPIKKASNINEDLSLSHDALDSLVGGCKRSASKKSATGNLDETDCGELQKSMHNLSTQSSLSLQWETRQIKVLQAATLDHALKFLLLINSSKDSNSIDLNLSSSADPSNLEEERNNVAHIIHVLFCTYRIYTNPYELMLKIMDYSEICRVEQYRFVMHYWMDNYPEDFNYIVESPENTSQKFSSTPAGANGASYSNSITSYDSSYATNKTAPSSESNYSASGGGPTDSLHSEISNNLVRRFSNLSCRTNDDTSKSGVLLVNELLRLCGDKYIREKALKIIEMKLASTISDGDPANRKRANTSSKSSAVLDFDSRYVAQQLTALDLENFLSLRPYSLLEGTKSDKRIQSMVKNFNLLSRHVVVTTLKSHSPHIVASHWISIAMNLKKIKNFNSLKAIIAGLTNESIYRLKTLIWGKIDRLTMSNFKMMASIVDDVNNQTVLRQTQLVVEGTAKMSIEDDSFGTIPYLGTFLTDLNMIDARYPSYIPSPKDETSKLKLINFEKCAKQFEILAQVQLLQKNVLASLHAIQRRNHFDEQSTLNRLKLEFNNQMLLAKPAVPQVSRLFESWFYDENVASMTDKQCYEISVTLEQNVVIR